MVIRSGRIEAFVGDADYPLELKIKELRMLQATLNSGPSAVAERLQTGSWMVDDIIETIRLALIGGGMAHAPAKLLTDNYVCAGYLVEYLPVALRCLFAALVGDQEDQPDMGEPPAPTTETQEV